MRESWDEGLERKRLESWGSVKAVKLLVARQPWKEGTEAGREAAGQIQGKPREKATDDAEA